MEGLIRQGDILLVPVTDKAELARVRRGKTVPRKRGLGIVVAEGEATGHHHRVSTKGVKLIEVNGVLYLKGPEAELVHEEHDTLTIPRGTHKVVRQREYEPPAAPKRAPRQQYVRD